MNAESERLVWYSSRQPDPDADAGPRIVNNPTFADSSRETLETDDQLARYAR